MAEETVTQQIVREAPEIEAYKLKLLQEAQKLAFNQVPGGQTLAQQLPNYQVAGFSPAQLAAIKATEQQGVGAFTPYMNAANTALGSAYKTTGEAADIMRGADTRAQFTDAQKAMQQAGGATANITAGVGQINQGLGYLDTAAQRAAASDTTGQFKDARADLATGLGSLATAQNMAAQSSQANLQPATAAIAQGIGGLTQAQQLALGAGAADFSGSQALMSQAAGQLQGAQPNFDAAGRLIGGGLAQGQDAIGMASQAAKQPGFIAQNLALGEAMGAARQAGPSDFSTSYQNLQGAAGEANQASLMAQQAAGQTGFAQAQQAITQGLGALGGGTQAYDPASSKAFMDPYRQQVIDETMKQMDRQSAIAGQGLAAQAVRAGAFGGEREGIQRAEMQRNLMDQKASTIANLLSQGYSQSQAQSMAAFEQQQQRQLQSGQAAGALGSQLAGVASQAGGLGLQAAQQKFQEAGFDAQTAMQMAQLQQTQGSQAAQQSQLMQGIGGLYGQAAQAQGALGQQAAQLAAQQAGLGVQAGSQVGALEAQRAQIGQAGAGQLANIGQQVGAQAAQQAQLGQAAAGLYGNLAQNQVAAGQGLGQLGVQQAQLGQGAAGQYLQAAQQYGNLASQGGALAGQEAAINQNIANLMMQQSQARNQAAQTAAGIYGQQAQQFQGLGQGIGQLAGQQFGIGQATAQGLGALGGQLGQLGVQQGALGQTAQALQQGDVNFLYNVGQAQQAFNQQGLDAARANELQKVYAPYQQAGFLSDIYKGAPSSQMATTGTSQPSASPFQQAVGIGLGGIATAAGAKRAGLF